MRQFGGVLLRTSTLAMNIAHFKPQLFKAFPELCAFSFDQGQCGGVIGPHHRTDGRRGEFYLNIQRTQLVEIEAQRELPLDGVFVCIFLLLFLGVLLFVDAQV